MAGKSVSHHHHQSTWQRTELRQVYGNTGMMKTDCMMGVCGDIGVAEIDGVKGGRYLGDPGIDGFHRILYLVSHIISHYHISSSYHTTNYTLHVSHLLIPLALSETPCGSAQMRGSSQPGIMIPSYPLPTLLEPARLILTNPFWNAVKGAAEC